MIITIYGPPASGKTTIGLRVAQQLGYTFVDVDQYIIEAEGKPIAEIFAEEGEATFRALEQDAIFALTQRDNLVIAPGGGALVNAETRRHVMQKTLVVCLQATPETVIKRTPNDKTRPLLGGDRETQIRDLLAKRQEIYDSFDLQIATDHLGIDQVVKKILPYTPWQGEVVSQHGGTYPVIIGESTRLYTPMLLEAAKLPAPNLIVSDDTVGPLWGEALAAHLGIPLVTVPAGEDYKTLATVSTLYAKFLEHGLDRNSVVLALGGGVIGDMTGFAAATYMRGIRWVNMPTTLLSMVDASIGAKTGVDLPQGKNLVGAFHPPAMVVIDPRTLTTLERREYTSGLGEVIKHAIIADPGLLSLLPGKPGLIKRALQVKIDIVAKDPYERAERAKLNLGHTIGHGIEAASGFKLLHGECIAIGMVAEAYLAAELGYCDANFAKKIAGICKQVGLPTTAKGLDAAHIRQLMSADKKKSNGKLRFALPIDFGRVDYGIETDDDRIMRAIEYVLR